MSKEVLERHVEVSANLDDYVYDYEKKHANFLKAGDSNEVAKQNAVQDLKTNLTKDNLTLVEATYDPDTGVAAIAVKDSQTGETYISYAGTNLDADGLKDVDSDLSIGLNDPLHLKKLGNQATAFYDQIQATDGTKITVVSGHSYGDFLATRVAIERQVPYKFGFQGAPQSVSKLTAQEIIVNQIYSNRGIPTKELLDAVDSARVESDRVSKLMENYKGYAVTFSTTGDFLTNGLWKANDKEINFVGSRTNGSLRFGVSLLGGMVGTFPDTKYVGHVIAIDVNTKHSMYNYRVDQSVMAYTKQIISENILGVDFNQDGNQEFFLTQDYLTTQSLLPMTAQSAKEIKLDKKAMTVLSNNLRNVKSQIESLIDLTSQAKRSNDDVLSRLSSRRQSLKDAIMRELEAVSLIEAVRQIDDAFNELGNLENDISTVANYDSYSFTRKFDWLGDSGNYEWYQDGSKWDYGPISRLLSDSSWEASCLKNLISDNQLTCSPGYGYRYNTNFCAYPAKTDVAGEGVELINSFEKMIEESTSGLDNRSHFDDGIPQATKEILQVVLDNLTTLKGCTQYLISVTELIHRGLSDSDDSLATDIKNLDLSRVPEVRVTISDDYQTFLEESKVFDDKTVLVAFDDQVDQKSEDLADKMSKAYGEYLSTVEHQIESVNRYLGKLAENFSQLSHDMPKQLQYKKEEFHFFSEDNDQTPLMDYGKIGDHITVSSTISKLAGNGAGTGIGQVDTKLTQAATTINTVYSYLGNFKQPFRLGMEEAFYGVSGLDEIVKSQLAVSSVLKAMHQRFKEFQSTLSYHSGLAVEALSDKLDGTLLTLSNVSKMLDECFGD
ncbi:SA1320 family protein [Streptococcus uberis]|uniref:SA1320 family protein n=1 Tax=Streptococcus uberis TaxID=1349 RepID=UPI001E501649|nr:hypothetical protein [Streptococcus uberis]